MSDVVIELGRNHDLGATAAEFQAAGWATAYGEDTSDPTYFNLVTDAEGNSSLASCDLVNNVCQWLVLSGANRATLIIARIIDANGNSPWYILLQWLGPHTIARIGVGFFHVPAHPIKWTDHGDGTVHMECLPTVNADVAQYFNGEHNFQAGAASPTGTLILDVEPSNLQRKVIITSVATGLTEAYGISAGMTGLATGLEVGVYELIVKSGADYEHWRGQVEIVDGEVTRISALLQESVTLIALTVNITPSPPSYEGHQITVLQGGEAVAQADAHNTRFLLPPGAYTVRSTLPDHETAESTVTLVDASVTLPVDLQAVPGAFCVNTLDKFDWSEGAGYTIDIYEAGEKVGTLSAPYGQAGAVIDVPRGYHEYDLELRYGSMRAPMAARTRVAVTIGSSLVVQDVVFGVPLTTFTISSELPDSVIWRTDSLGARISEIGPAPQQLTMGGHVFTGMASGKVYFTIEAPGYFPITKLITLEGNDYASDPEGGEDAPIPHEIIVRETDAEAEDATIGFGVTIDGQPIELWCISLDDTLLPRGVTMVARPAGTYLIRFHAPKAWFDDYTMELTVESGESYTATHNFTTPQATFRIGDVRPATAEVQLDGQVVNEEVLVAAGSHEFRVTATGYTTAEGRITLNPGIYTFNLTMSELQEQVQEPPGGPLGRILEWLTGDVATRGPAYIALALGAALIVVLLLVRR